jgi:hypothetical protein
MDFNFFNFVKNTTNEFKRFNSLPKTNILNVQHEPKIYLNQPSLSYYSEKLNFYNKSTNEETFNNHKKDEESDSLSSNTNTSEICIEGEIISSSRSSSSSIYYPEGKLSNSKIERQTNSNLKRNLVSDVKKTVDLLINPYILSSNDISLQTKTANKSFDIPFDYGVVSGLFLDQPEPDNLKPTTIFAITLNEKRRKNTEKYNSNQSVLNKDSNLRLNELNRNFKNDFPVKHQTKSDNNNQLIFGKIKEMGKKTNNSNTKFKLNEEFQRENSTKTMHNIYFSKKISSPRKKIEKDNSVSVLELDDEKEIIDYLKTTVDKQFQKVEQQSNTDKMIEMCAIMLDNAFSLGQVDELLRKLKHSLN